MSKMERTAAGSASRPLALVISPGAAIHGIGLAAEIEEKTALVGFQAEPAANVLLIVVEKEWFGGGCQLFKIGHKDPLSEKQSAGNTAHSAQHLVIIPVKIHSGTAVVALVFQEHAGIQRQIGEALCKGPPRPRASA